jgi:PAP2 superfamily
MRDRDWFLPSLGLTVFSIAAVLAVTPDYGGLLHALRILPAWLAMTAILPLTVAVVRMHRQGVVSPFAAIAALVRRNREMITRTGCFMTLAGINLIVFMWMKPLLNKFVPFWADPLLASFDNALFLGQDPWTLLTWLDSPVSGLIYHPLWFIGMIVALLLTAAAPPSDEKSTVLLGYFTLWSVVAPLVHTILPAAGPIFYERMGYGARFAAIDGGPATRMVGDYLWSLHAAGNFGAGSGISAMPSMHVTISTDRLGGDLRAVDRAGLALCSRRHGRDPGGAGLPLWAAAGIPRQDPACAGPRPLPRSRRTLARRIGRPQIRPPGASVFLCLRPAPGCDPGVVARA